MGREAVAAGEGAAEAGSGATEGSAQGARARAGLRERLGSLAARGGAAAGRLADSAREQLGTGALVKQALAARDRGNLDAAFALLREARDQAPADLRVARELWAVALACERAPEALETAERLVDRHARAGEPELAAQYWRELVSAAPEARLAPALLLRLVPVLRQWQRDAEAAAAAAAGEAPGSHAAPGTEAPGAGGATPDVQAAAPSPNADAARDEARALLVRALRDAAAAGEEGLTPGLALRLFEEAHEVDAGPARVAARVALASPDLHETKRERVESWLAGG